MHCLLFKPTACLIPLTSTDISRMQAALHIIIFFFCTLFSFFVFLNIGSSRMVASLGLAHRISIAQHGIIPRTTARTAKLDHLMGHFLLASPKFLGHFCLCLNSCTCTVSTKIFFCHFVLLPLCPLHLFSSCCFFALANSAAWS